MAILWPLVPHPSLLFPNCCFLAVDNSTKNHQKTAVGEWRSQVAHLLWEQRVGGSNPLSPTKFPLIYKNLSVPIAFCGKSFTLFWGKFYTSVQSVFFFHLSMACLANRS